MAFYHNEPIVANVIFGFLSLYNKPMNTLLLHIKGSRIYNFTLFRPHLYVYNDRVVYKKRHILTHDEFSIHYRHISQANFINFIYLFAHIEIVTTGQRFIKIHWVPKKQARIAKKIIDEKVHQVHKDDFRTPEEGREDPGYVNNFEMSLKRLRELLNVGKISQKEFNKRRKELLKKHY